MADRKRITLGDLDKDELIRLVQSRVFWMESDLVWAQWEVATTRLKAAADAAVTHCARLGLPAKAFDAARAEFVAAQSDLRKMNRALKKIDRANDEYQRIQSEQQRLDAKVDRLRRRADRLYQQYRELPR